MCCVLRLLITVRSGQELRESVGRTVGAGLNMTGRLLEVAVPLAQSAVQQAPVIINSSRAALASLNTRENRERVGQLQGAGSRVAAGVAGAAAGAPELLQQGASLAGSVIHAANDTAPLVLQGIQEFTDQLPLITGFASAYAEVNAEQAQVVARTFYTSLQCDLHCKDITDDKKLQECKLQYCTKPDQIV